jgi:dipeptidyl aminopeptidase/acylaminoacyl peptidase
MINHEVDAISYCSDGHPVEAWVYKPPEALADRAGIVLCPGRERDIEGLAFLARILAGTGFIVLAIRYRGSSLENDASDARDGLTYLVEQVGVDAERLGVVGHSRGAVCALHLAASDLRIRSVVALEPPADLARIVEGGKHLSSTRYEMLTAQIGATPTSDPELYADLSTMGCAHEIKVPVLILGGTLDLFAPEEYCRAMYEKIEAGGNDRAEYVTMDIGHFFEHKYYGYKFDEVGQLCRDWFERTL